MKFKRIAPLSLSFALLLASVPISASSASINEGNNTTLNSYVNLEDVKATQAFLSNKDYVGSGNIVDMNQDGVVNVFDLLLLKRELLNTPVPSLVNFSADFWDIYLDTEEAVTFTVEVTEVSPLTENALAVYDDSDTFISYMYDDGTNGDKIANDGIYSTTVVLTSNEIKTVEYHAATKQVQSNPFEICFYRDLEEDEFLDFFRLQGIISQFSFEEACAYVKISDEIKSYTIDDENQIITYQSIYGIYGSWEQANESLDASFLGTGVYAVPDENGVDYAEAENIVSSSSITPLHANKKDVIVLRPFRGTEVPWDDFLYAGNLVADALESNVTVVDDDGVTIDQMKALSSYGTVLIHSHGTLKSQKTPYILIGEELNETKFLWDPGYYLKHVKYSADYISGRIYCTGYHDRLAVGGKFFEKYYSNGSLDDSFWFLGTCYNMYDNSIADALTSKGAEAVVGFTNVVSVAYCNYALFETVVNSMLLSADTVNHGVMETKRIYGAVDPYRPPTEFKRKGKINFRLVDDIQNRYFPELAKTYSGSYVAQQGLTALDFTIYSCDTNGNVDALFSFYEHSDNPGVPSGSYTMHGKVTNVSNNNEVTIKFTGDKWVVHPGGYSILNFTAVINNERTRMISNDYELNLTTTYTHDFLDITKKYSGTYQNSAGLMGLDFTIDSCTDDGNVTALFSFYSHPDNPNTPSGSYTMTGTISNISKNGDISIRFTGNEWIDRPGSYSFANFTAKINAERTQLTSSDYQISLTS